MCWQLSGRLKETWAFLCVDCTLEPYLPTFVNDFVKNINRSDFKGLGQQLQIIDLIITLLFFLRDIDTSQELTITFILLKEVNVGAHYNLIIPSTEWGNWF